MHNPKLKILGCDIITLTEMGHISKWSSLAASIKGGFKVCLVAHMCVAGSVSMGLAHLS